MPFSKTLAVGGIGEDIAGAVRLLGQGYDKITIKSNCLQAAFSPTVKSSIFDVSRFLTFSNFTDAGRNKAWLL